MQEIDTSAKKRSFWKRLVSIWPNIRLGLEALSFVLLFLHMIPENAVEKLRGSFLGVFIILGIITVISLLHSIQQSNLISSNEVNYYSILEQKQSEMNRKSQEISTLQGELLSKTNSINYLTNYKTIFALNNKTFASLREAYRENLISGDKAELRSGLNEFCNNVNEIFSKLKKIENKECHVCIKVFTQPANNNFKSHQSVKVKVKTFMRDARGDGTRSNIDRERIDHYVSDNTDFLAIFEENQTLENRCFISNDLMLLDEYRNSSFKRHNKDKLPYYIRGTKWPLPYRSCITAPVCPGITHPDLKAGTLIGFLCVDFVSENKIDENDVQIVAGLAEGLYDTLNHYINKYVLKIT